MTHRRAVAHWWTHCPPANIGLACGPSGLVVIDLDTPKNPEQRPPGEWSLPGVTEGADVLAVLAERRGEPFPFDTYAVRTGRGGLHLYFRTPIGVQLRNTAGKLGWLIDTRASGGYVLAAGSTVNGRPYTVVHDIDPAPLPSWLTELLTADENHPRPCAGDVLANLSRPSGYTGAALRGEVQRVLDSGAHQHNNTLNTAAYNLGRLVGSGLLPRDLVYAALTRAGEAVGQRSGEAAATVNSGLRAGITRPRRAPA